jgi:hypothetical protein
MDNIGKSEATGEDIEKIISKLEPVLEKEPRTHVLMACLAIALIANDPDITTERLVTGVRDLSQWICLYLDDSSGATQFIPTDKAKLN